MKKFISVLFTVLLFRCYADDFQGIISKTISKVVPNTDKIVTIKLPVYAETSAASEFSPYLKNSIEVALTDLDKEIFDLKLNELSESFIADLNDSGYISDKNWAKQKMPDGELQAEFLELNNKVTISFAYKKFAGNIKKAQCSISTKDLPGLTYKPENLELAKTIYKDIETAKTEAKKNSLPIKIEARMLNIDGNKVDILYPNDDIKFKVCTDCDSYIAIMGIDSTGTEYWLEINDNFMQAGIPRIFPDADIKYIVKNDGIFGQEYLYIFAASFKEDLPQENIETVYTSNNITKRVRAGIMSVRNSNNRAMGYIEIPYTILKGEKE